MGVNQRAQIRMSDDEVAAFLRQSRTATVATIGPGGFPHLVAMWYGLSHDGQVVFETKARSQKAVNLRRDPTISCSVEAGESYDQYFKAGDYNQSSSSSTTNGAKVKFYSLAIS